MLRVFTYHSYQFNQKLTDIGIGLATAELAGSKGAKIVIGDLDEMKSRNAVTELQKNGYEASYFAGDLLDPSTAPKLVQHALDTFGKVNVLINAAGKTSYSLKD